MGGGWVLCGCKAWVRRAVGWRRRACGVSSTDEHPPAPAPACLPARLPVWSQSHQTSRPSTTATTVPSSTVPCCLSGRIDCRHGRRVRQSHPALGSRLTTAARHRGLRTLKPRLVYPALVRSRQQKSLPLASHSSERRSLHPRSPADSLGPGGRVVLLATMPSKTDCRPTAAGLWPFKRPLHTVWHRWAPSSHHSRRWGTMSRTGTRTRTRTPRPSTTSVQR